MKRTGGRKLTIKNNIKLPKTKLLFPTKPPAKNDSFSKVRIGGKEQEKDAFKLLEEVLPG
jgi:hypothetical protein